MTLVPPAGWGRRVNGGTDSYYLPLEQCPGLGARQLKEFRSLEITPCLIAEASKDSLPKFPVEGSFGAKIHP